MPSFIYLFIHFLNQLGPQTSAGSLTEEQIPLVPPTAAGKQEYLVIITYCLHCNIDSLYCLEKSNFLPSE